MEADVPKTSEKEITMLSLIQSNFSRVQNGPGNLELVVLVGGQLHFYWRDDAYAFDWHGGDPIRVDGQPLTGVTDVSNLVQSRFGQKGNFELVVSLADGSLAHLWRDNDATDPGSAWHQLTRIVPGPVRVKVLGVGCQTRDEARATLAREGLVLRATGNGRLADFRTQDPRAGTFVPVGTEVVVDFKDGLRCP